MNPRLSRSLSMLTVLLFSHTALGEPSGDSMFPVANQGALARGFALPALGQSTILEPGQREWRVALDWTNEFVDEQTATETILEDGESERLALNWRQGFGKSFEMNAELPLLVTGGGILDGVIQNWHNLFGLPDGGRDAVANNQYHYQYVRNGQTVLDVDTATAGIGDVTVGGGWQVWSGLALRAMVKLPTGDASKLLGGNPGGAIWADYNLFPASPRWSGFVSAGASINGSSDTLGSQQHPAVGFGGAGVGYRLYSHWLVLGQLYAHSQLYRDSDVSPFQRNGLQMTLGGRYEFSDRSGLTFGFQEDLITNSSPDFSLHLDWRWR